MTEQNESYMDLLFTPYTLPFVGSAVIFAGLLVIAWNHRRDPVARWFGATLIALLVWSVGYILELSAFRLDDKVLLANLQFIGAGSVSVCWWELTRRYLHLGRVPGVVTVVLWLIPAMTVAVALANPGGLFRGTPYIDTLSGPFALLVADYGPWYLWVVLPGSLILNGLVLCLLSRAAVRSHGFQRKQFLVLFFAVSLPLLTTFLYTVGITPWSGYNLTVATAGISGLMLATGLFRWQLFDVVPLARDLVVENLADSVIVVDQAGRVVDLNESAKTLTGLGRGEVVGRPGEQVLAQYPVLLDLVQQGKGVRGNMIGHREMVIKRGGRAHYYSVSLSPITTRRGGTRVGGALVLHEVTDRMRLLEQARELANKDDLTGLANRRHFFELATREFERSKRYGNPTSLILIDVDHFKQVNDSYGHSAGDLLLRELATICKANLRSTDVIGRFGGEEFGVLLPQTPLGEAQRIAQRLRTTVEGLRVEVNSIESPMRVTISAGVAEFGVGASPEVDKLDTVLERADKALYDAKGQGRNVVVTSSVAAPERTLRVVG